LLSFRLLLATLASRRVQIVGATPHPGEPFMQQVVRTLTAAEDGLRVLHRVLICDRDNEMECARRGTPSPANDCAVRRARSSGAESLRSRGMMTCEGGFDGSAHE